MFDANRRKYPRANFPCQLTMWLADGASDTILVETTNIGAGGVCVQINRGIDLGAQVDIQVHFKNPTTPFKCRGIVVRSRKVSETQYDIGIQFEPLGELKSAFLDGKVSELIELENKRKS
ncbi:MAG: PilZ domain-containing protein [Candidatus Omnitrophica bacterium]|nr:PilZ domain-containing protein [Candidatus Omnitrophota bacterium]MDE2009564.1 PilZ domain-containing protein [Candidatus Omnitrophota bacterium]MDE2214608.1 PilZ domain-containing protein [Candidatus Omnitrophota bacterium]MDE2231685.1 PilZ domain-containing protein [Candidatus Omnitrophota bacterium]